MEFVWSLNVAGLQGLWRLSHFVHSQPEGSRPAIICVQEAACNQRQLDGLERFWSHLGYHIFVGISAEYMSRGVPKGVLSLVRSNMSARVIFDSGHAKGAVLGVAVDDLLIINSYAAADSSGQQQQTQASAVEELLVSADWCGRILLVGDFNEPWETSWISVVAILHNLHPIPLRDEFSSRWSGNEIVDYGMADQQLTVESWFHTEVFSDHKMVVFQINKQFRRADEMKFPNHGKFQKPGWLNQQDWQSLFDEAVQHGIRTAWQQAAFELNHEPKWVHSGCQADRLNARGRTCPGDLCYCEPSSWGDLPDTAEAREEDIQFQDMIDYSWDFFSRKVAWCFKVALQLSLCRIPADYVDFDEIKKVELAINGKIRKGKNKLICRQYPKSGGKMDVRTLTIRKRLGRACEMRSKIRAGRPMEEISTLSFKLFRRLVDIDVLENEIHKLSYQAETLEQAQKFKNLATWRRNIQSSLTKKGQWLQPKGCYKNVAVKTESGYTRNKEETAIELRNSWKNLMQKVAWTDQERSKALAELKGFFAHRISADFPFSRPSHFAFSQALCDIQGCAGIDGWSCEETRMVGNNAFLCQLAWEEMFVWEEMAIAPSSLQDVILLHIPKPGKLQPSGECSSADLRPLTIFSIWWRAWSACWIKCPRFNQFIHQIMPRGLTLASKGGCGAECLASICDHELSRLGYGVTLDFRSCFDTIDLPLIRDALSATLPPGLHGWINLLISHWIKVDKWIGINGHILSRPLNGHTGIPQGDAASPAILSFFLWQGFEEVQSELNLMGGQFFQAIYMDDRTVLADRPDLIEAAIHVWHTFASKRKLLENMNKLQKVSCAELRPEGFGTSMEVLGATIGLEDPMGLQLDTKQTKRLNKAFELVQRLGILPESKLTKMKDFGVFVMGVYAYGWISVGPQACLGKELHQTMLQAIGRLPYGVPQLKKLLLFTHLDLVEMVLVRQIRLLARRNFALAGFAINLNNCTLDHMVHLGLRLYGWVSANGFWSRHGFSFRLSHCLDEVQWSRIAHEIRDSIRQWHYLRLMTVRKNGTMRHEMVGQELPPFDPDRLCLVRRWMRKSTVATLLATGSICSAAARLRSQPNHRVACPCCSEPGVHWGHYWNCWLKMEPPADLLLRRFLWPRCKADLQTCDIFCEWAAKLLDCHGQAFFSAELL